MRMFCQCIPNTEPEIKEEVGLGRSSNDHVYVRGYRDTQRGVDVA